MPPLLTTAARTSPARSADRRLSIEAAAAAVSAVTEDNSVLCIDGRITRLCAALDPALNRRRQVLAPEKLGDAVLGLAIGAQAVDLDRQVVALTGPAGGRTMLKNLAFIAAGGLAVKLVSLRFDDVSLDLAAAAEGRGIFGRRVCVLEELRIGLADAFDYDGPALVDIRVA
jgi:pyruvate dehydrogenase (quinone)